MDEHLVLNSCLKDLRQKRGLTQVFLTGEITLLLRLPMHFLFGEDIFMDLGHFLGILGTFTLIYHWEFYDWFFHQTWLHDVDQV